MDLGDLDDQLDYDDDDLQLNPDDNDLQIDLLADSQPELVLDINTDRGQHEVSTSSKIVKESVSSSGASKESCLKDVVKTKNTSNVTKSIRTSKTGRPLIKTSTTTTSSKLVSPAITKKRAGNPGVIGGKLKKLVATPRINKNLLASQNVGGGRLKTAQSRAFNKVNDPRLKSTSLNASNQQKVDPEPSPPNDNSTPVPSPTSADFPGTWSSYPGQSRELKIKKSSSTSLNSSVSSSSPPGFGMTANLNSVPIGRTPGVSGSQSKMTSPSNSSPSGSVSGDAQNQSFR